MDIQEFINHFAEQFDDVPAAIAPESNFRDIDDWSSLVALSVIAMADEEYGVKLTGDDIRNATTVNDLFEAIKSKKN